MALQPPSPQTNVPRADVANVVNAMLFDERVKWISVIFCKAEPGMDLFEVTPYVADPT
jgi:hypothetical protein